MQPARHALKRTASDMYGPDVEARLRRHRDMMSLCSRWANNNGLEPSFDKRHLAPDGEKVFVGQQARDALGRTYVADGIGRLAQTQRIDFAQFFFGIPPWNTVTGDVNPDGVAPCSPTDCQRAAELAAAGPSGYRCQYAGCQAWVDIAPRPFRGPGDEPYWWWWCTECRKSNKFTKRELADKKLVASCRKMSEFFGGKQSK